MYKIIIQNAASNAVFIPKPTSLRNWAKKALSNETESAEATIRIVDIEEMTTLNSTYRNKQGPTNVLSFPFDMPAEIKLDIPILGDIVICADVVNREAMEQKKPPEAHWAHMVVHGMFHLLGYDHEVDEEADRMEALEIGVMEKLGYPNPYRLSE